MFSSLAPKMGLCLKKGASPSWRGLKISQNIFHAHVQRPTSPSPHLPACLAHLLQVGFGEHRQQREAQLPLRGADRRRHGGGNFPPPHPPTPRGPPDRSRAGHGHGVEWWSALMWLYGGMVCVLVFFAFFVCRKLILFLASWESEGAAGNVEMAKDWQACARHPDGILAPRSSKLESTAQ